uniref:NADH dehydrogenase subunit 6 n=1 Tax=Stenus clavicornis TaxID=1202167 RepID=A0A191ZS10_9COLE|nr:NADH dehydrogenase subunit 6 [Stenus clavicornis]
MLQLMMFLMLNLMIMTLFMFHPLIMSMILLMMIILIVLSNIFLIKFCWFSYIIFIIMIGGVLIIFTYMTSIASNESFKFNKNIIFFTVLIFLLMLIFFNFNFIEFQDNINSSFFLKYFNFPINMMMIFLFIYLYLTLIACVKITNFNQGPLRQKL